VTAASSAAFCDRWNDLLHEPIRPIKEAEARRRDGAGEPYVVILGTKDKPESLVEVNWSNDYIATWFMDDELRRHVKYSFTKTDKSTLFLDQIKMWDYPEDAKDGLSSATKVTSFSYSQDGVAHETIDDSAAGTVETISRSDVPLNINWEQVPEFGDWASISRWDRQT
jgi:hypothetical protein